MEGIVNMDIPIELEQKIKFELYTDNSGKVPRLALRIRSNTFDKMLFLSLDQAQILGRSIASAANKLQGMHIISKGSLSGPI